MKPKLVKNLAVLIATAVWMPAWAAVTPPVYEGFETNAAGTALTSMTNQGWSASAVDVVVIASNSMGAAVAGGTNAVAIPLGAVVSNLMTSASPSVIWVDFQKRQSVIQAVDETALLIDGNAAVQVCLNTNRSVWLYDKGIPGWTNLVTDYWGTNVSAFCTSDWSRVTIYENFSTHKSGLFLDGHLIRDQVSFVTNRSSFAGFRYENGQSGTNYLDEVRVWTNVPTGLSEDLDNDMVADAQELQTYGNISTWHRWTNTVATTGSGSGTVTPPAGTMTTVTNGTTLSYTFTAAAGSGISAVRTNGGAYTYSGDSKTGACSWVISTDGTFTVVFDTKTTWSVPSDLATITGAVANAQDGDTIVISNGMSAADLTLDKQLTLTGTNVTITGALTLNQGITNTLNAVSNLTAATVQVGTNASLIVSNATVNFTTLGISSGGVVRVVNGTVAANGATMTGDFSLDWTWGQPGVTPAPLNFLDTFESYGSGTLVNMLGAAGWRASSSSVLVQSSTKYAGNRAMQVAAGATVSNAIASLAGQTNIWTDLWLDESSHVGDFLAESIDTNASVQVCLTTNKFLAVYYNEAWHICSNDVRNMSVAGVYSSGWARVTINQNYGTGKSAIFLNGRLLRQNVPFIKSSRTQCAGLKVVGGAESATYLDNVSLATNVPAELNTLAYDVNLNGIPDVQEIHGSGVIAPYSAGSIYSIR